MWFAFGDKLSFWTKLDIAGWILLIGDIAGWLLNGWFCWIYIYVVGYCFLASFIFCLCNVRHHLYFKQMLKNNIRHQIYFKQRC